MLRAFAAGRIARINDMRYTPSGTAVLGFVLAVDTGYGEHKKTQWLDCALFGKRAEGLQPHLSKGMAISVLGEAEPKGYQGRDGWVSTIGVRVDELTMQGKSKPADNQPASRPAANAQTAPVDGGDFDDDIPFAQLAKRCEYVI